MNYHERQQAQLQKFLTWVRTEGGLELPTQLRTLMKPEQQKRLQWLRERVVGRILEVGTNWGFVLAYLGGHTGIDINPNNVRLARIVDPVGTFYVGEADHLPFPDNSFDTVVIPETLEHLVWPDEVHAAIVEGLRIASTALLITMPDGSHDSEEACNFKHLYLADAEVIKTIEQWLRDMGTQVSSETVGPFICIHAMKEKA